MAERQQFFTVSIPLEYSETDRELLAKNIMRFIQDRTDGGNDIEGNAFAEYSESYINSLDFKNAGKSPSEVNLQLSGDMLYTTKLLNHGEGYITIGYESGSAENDKAAWQQENTQPNFPKRKFLGINDSDLTKLLNDFPPSQDREIEVESQVDETVIENIFRSWGV